MLSPAEFINQREYPGIDRPIYEAYNLETGFMLANADESILLFCVLGFVVVTIGILKKISVELDDLVSW